MAHPVATAPAAPQPADDGAPLILADRARTNRFAATFAGALRANPAFATDGRGRTMTAAQMAVAAERLVRLGVSDARFDTICRWALHHQDDARHCCAAIVNALVARPQDDPATARWRGGDRRGIVCC